MSGNVSASLQVARFGVETSDYAARNLSNFIDLEFF